MSWLMFVDESGHDHKKMPYEVRGGIVVHVSRLAHLICDIHAAHVDLFGKSLHVNDGELKGEKLLAKRRFKWASTQKPGSLTPDAQRSLIKTFTSPKEDQKPTRSEFFAYGSASLGMATTALNILKAHDVKLFASLIPRGSPQLNASNELREDLSHLLAVFGLFLEERGEHGLMIMDETEKTHDRNFISKLRTHATDSKNSFSPRIVPTPLFVASEMTEGIQLADLCLYMLNWGAYRVAGMSGKNDKGEPDRPEIVAAFSKPISSLFWNNQNDTSVFHRII